MLRIHKEGRVSLLIVAIFIAAVTYLVAKLIGNVYFTCLIAFLSLAFFLFVMYFFRVVDRPYITDEGSIMAPCDGTVVVIEKRVESEFFNDERIQVSIFMSPLNVHMNWYPVGGKILKANIQRGSHLVAWAPKSSTHNERSTVVIETQNGQQILVRQIAGAVARRVVSYAKEGINVKQNGHLGFIKFGSRVDLFLPTNVDIKVELNQKTVGSQSIIASFKND